MEGGQRRSQKSDSLPAGRNGREENPLPRNLRHRHQACVEGRHPAPGAQGHSVHDRQRLSVTDPGYKGNIMKYTEGAFKDWGYELAVERFGAEPVDGGPWHQFKNPKTGKTIIVKDVIADAFLQQILMRPDEYSV